MGDGGRRRVALLHSPHNSEHVKTVRLQRRHRQTRCTFCMLELRGFAGV